MANFNINDLAAITALGDADIFEVEQGGVNKKFTGAQLKTYLGLIGAPISFQGNYDISVDTFPPSAIYGYIYYTAATNSSALKGHDGGVIAKGSVLIANKVSGFASTTLNSDWIIIPAQY